MRRLTTLLSDRSDHYWCPPLYQELPADSTTTVPTCIDGRRACPPEDCGGTWGYRELLEILADPPFPSTTNGEWIDRPFDPEAFDPSAFEDNLRNQQLANVDDQP